ncbi:hypothetical protein ASF12_27540 [Paenibacillus sp. Leaf72]|nr:hypothetical protein ASF12_27540 [Paenibacillus sp. Leaf72]
MGLLTHYAKTALFCHPIREETHRKLCSLFYKKIKLPSRFFYSSVHLCDYSCLKDRNLGYKLMGQTAHYAINIGIACMENSRIVRTIKTKILL